MTRTEPSATDNTLLELLAVRGVVVTASQLERWRHVGLTPRPRQVHLGRGGSRAEYDQPLDKVADHVAAVAARSRRGRSAALTAVAVTADGYVVDAGLLRRGHQEAVAQAQAIVTTWLEQAQAVAADRPPADELEHAEQLAGAALARGGRTRTFWRRNVAADRQIVDGSSIDAVLESAVTAMVQLIFGGDPSPEAIYEATTAVGVQDLAVALATGGEADALTLEGRTKQVAALMQEQFNGVPVLHRLAEVADAPPEVLRAASTVAVTVWMLLDRSGVLGPVTAVVPPPTGDAPEMHTVAVAFVVHLAGTVGVQVEPVCEFAVAASLLSQEEASRCVAAAAVLSNGDLRARTS